MKIGVVGATGKAGSFIVKEALNRGHDVTAIVRDAGKVEEKDVRTLEKDIFDITANDIEGFDAVVNAFGAPEGKEHLHVEAGQSLIHVFKQAPDVRLLVVGGAGSLFVDEEKTTRLADTPDFPKEYKAIADNQAQNLKDLESTSDINWTFISPAAFFNPSGKRTDAYKTGKDHVILNSEGNSHVSYADYAIAVIDEIERGEHVNERFTVVSDAR